MTGQKRPTCPTNTSKPVLRQPMLSLTSQNGSLLQLIIATSTGVLTQHPWLRKHMTTGRGNAHCIGKSIATLTSYRKVQTKTSTNFCHAQEMPVFSNNITKAKLMDFVHGQIQVPIAVTALLNVGAIPWIPVIGSRRKRFQRC
jgi:hypothetical protein